MVGNLTGKFQKTFGSSGPEHFIADRGHPIQIVICLLKSQDLDTEIPSKHFHRVSPSPESHHERELILAIPTVPCLDTGSGYEAHPLLAAA